MNITVVTVGKIKEKYINLGIDEFSKRLKAYCKLNIIEVQDEATPDNASDKEEDLIRKKEGEKIRAKLPKNSYIIVLAIDGKQLSSEDLSRKIDELAIDGISDISFIIGGSLGLDSEIINLADYKLSFSKMTFPHQLMRLILLEQVYRSFRISVGAPYHK